MEKILSAKNLVKAYGKKEVLHSVSIDIEPGKIYGLIGRNGAGKTTLLSCLTAQNSFNSGEVTYGGEKVWENQKVLSEICFSREISNTLLWGQNNLKVKDYLRCASIYYPNWDKEYAEKLIEKFNLNTKTKIYKLSKGMLSMVTIIIAMASNAPITIMDEPVAGLDVSARDDFYNILLEDYAKTNRTFIVSTHIIEEAVGALEKIILIDNGDIIENCNLDEFMSEFHYIQGKDEDVDAASNGLNILHTEGIGRSKTVCVRCNDADLEKAVAGKSVDVTAVPLHKIFVYTTKETGKGE